MNMTNVSHIEGAFTQLTFEDQLWLLERLAHLMREHLTQTPLADDEEDRHDADIIEARRHEPTYALADVLAERRRATA